MAKRKKNICGGGRRRRSKICSGRGKVGDTIKGVAKDLAVEGAKEAGTFALKKLAGAAAGGPVGMGIQALVELGYRALKKAAKGDYTQSKGENLEKHINHLKTKEYKNITG